MLAGTFAIGCRVLTWSCIFILAFLSLPPGADVARTGLPGEFEHFVAYAGSGAVATVAYGRSWGICQIIGLFWVYAGCLELLQHFSPGRYPAMADFVASALGVLFGGLSTALIMRLFWKIDHPDTA
jgi:VanZ family protein